MRIRCTTAFFSCANSSPRREGEMMSSDMVGKIHSGKVGTINYSCHLPFFILLMWDSCEEIYRVEESFALAVCDAIWMGITHSRLPPPPQRCWAGAFVANKSQTAKQSITQNILPFLNTEGEGAHKGGKNLEEKSPFHGARGGEDAAGGKNLLSISKRECKSGWKGEKASRAL